MYHFFGGGAPEAIHVRSLPGHLQGSFRFKDPTQGGPTQDRNDWFRAWITNCRSVPHMQMASEVHLS